MTALTCTSEATDSICEDNIISIRRNLGELRLNLILNESELIELTGYRVAKFQKRTLDSLKIPSLKRRDGSLAVMREWCISAGESQKKLESLPQLKSAKR